MSNYNERERQRLQQERGQQMVARFNQAFVNPLARYAQTAIGGGLDLRQPDQKRLLNQIKATQSGITDWLSNIRNDFLHCQSNYPEYNPTDIIHAINPDQQIRALYSGLLTTPAGTGQHPVGLPHLLQSLGFTVETTTPDFFATDPTWQKVLQQRWADMYNRQQYTTSYRVKQADKVVIITVTTPVGQPNDFAQAVTTVTVDPFDDWNNREPGTYTQRQLDFITAIATTPQIPDNFPS
jgi:hypothetical protein